MLFGDTYHTIEHDATAELKDRGSKFIGHAYAVQHEDEIKQYLQRLKKEHHNAVHHCYAFVLGFDKEIQKFNDDREPSNSAGRPILRAILSKDVTNVAVIVVRYFGGKLLGVPGLIAAYEGAAKAALDNAGLKTAVLMERYELIASYELENEAFRIIKQFGLKILQHHHADTIKLIFEVRKADADKVLQAISERHQLAVKYLTTL